MTRSSRVIDAGLGVAAHVLAYTGTALAVVVGYALACVAHARAMARARQEPTVDVEPEQQTIALVVIDTSEPVQGDRVWN